MPFVNYIDDDATQALRGIYASEQFLGQTFLDATDPKVVTFKNRHAVLQGAQQAAQDQGKANARNANSLPQLIQALQDAKVI